MKILPTSGDSILQLIFRPRQNAIGDPVEMKVRNRSTNKEHLFSNVPVVFDQNYMKIDYTDAFKTAFPLVKNNYYDVTVFDSNNLLVRETLFITDQTINQKENKVYNPNKDSYKPVQSENEYIIL